jgi:hypothetical protein
MHSVDRITIQDGTHERSISFWQGNPADILPDDPVDLIIVSAFQNDYTPTRWSIIGALNRKGLSVRELAEDKAFDLRSTAGFWLSRPLPEETTAVGVKRILCFEPHFIGTHAIEVVGNLFRGLFPFLSDAQDATAAMAVIATGALGEDPASMLRALVSAAFMWMKRGLPIRELRIMEQNPKRVATLTPVFAEIKATSNRAEDDRDGNRFHAFLSFSSHDAGAADKVAAALRVRFPNIRLFDYRLSIDNGSFWQDEIDRAIRVCLKMIPLLSPAYFSSPECREELGVGRLLHKRRNRSFLFPLYTRSLANQDELPLWLQTITYIDCREADPDRLASAANQLELPSVAHTVLPVSET